MKPPFIKTQYNVDPREEGKKTALHCPEKTLTQQQFKDEADINVLFGRYLETGEMPQLETPSQYGDFTGIYDFQTAMNAVRAAQQKFEDLPARLKNRFENDPQKLLEFLNDPENLEEAQFLKLVKPRDPDPVPTTPAIPTRPTNPTEPTPSAAPAPSDTTRTDNTR